MNVFEIAEIFEGFCNSGFVPSDIPEELVEGWSEKDKTLLAGFIHGYEYAEMLNNTRVTLSESRTADDVKSCTHNAEQAQRYQILLYCFREQFSSNMLSSASSDPVYIIQTYNADRIICRIL